MFKGRASRKAATVMPTPAFVGKTSATLPTDVSVGKYLPTSEIPTTAADTQSVDIFEILTDFMICLQIYP